MIVRILLIDDDSDDRDIFCEALEMLTRQNICHTVSDGKKALSLLEEIELPDIIFLDINMPIMNGWECLQLLKGKEQFRQIPVIMYSTSSYKEDILKAQQLGALCFFTKPHDFEDLKNSLETVAEHLENNKLERLTLTSRSFVRLVE